MLRGTPWVRLKTASSLDGRSALEDGTSQWITGEHARADGHAWRARACAVLTGIGTVLQDDPRLDVRHVATPRQPHLVVVDSRLQTPLNARLFETGRQLLIYTAVQDPARRAELQARGATVLHLPNANGKVDLPAMLRDLGAREINELHVEAGHQLNGSFVREGLVDEFLSYVAPRLIGQGQGMASFGPVATLAQSVALRFESVERIGEDLRIVSRIPGRDRF
jgi:diaminohydroxyphosphoribosylaminopyrimidine deaminase / 5-amino-6-(5-phosphoribosylamino)uracil reductase